MHTSPKPAQKFGRNLEELEVVGFRPTCGRTQPLASLQPRRLRRSDMRIQVPPRRCCGCHGRTSSRTTPSQCCRTARAHRAHLWPQKRTSRRDTCFVARHRPTGRPRASICVRFESCCRGVAWSHMSPLEHRSLPLPLYRTNHKRNRPFRGHQSHEPSALHAHLSRVFLRGVVCRRPEFAGGGGRLISCGAIRRSRAWGHLLTYTSFEVPLD